MHQPAKTGKRATRTYHFHFTRQKTRPGEEARYMMYRSADGHPIDVDSDDADYDSLNLSKADLDRLFVAALHAYGVAIKTDEVAKFQMNARVAPGLHDDVETLSKEIELLRSQLKAANGTIKRLLEAAPVLSVNGKVGHVVLTRDDLAETPVEGNPIPAECGVESVQGKVGHVQLTASDFPQPTSQITRNLIDVDMRVRHPVFGYGTVKRVFKRDTPNATADIQFDDSTLRGLFVSSLLVISKSPAPKIAMPETLTFDESDHDDEDTPVKLQHLTYIRPEGVCVERFIPRSLGLLFDKEGIQHALFADIRILARNPDGHTVDEILRFVNPHGEDLMQRLVESSTPYSTAVMMVKES